MAIDFRANYKSDDWETTVYTGPYVNNGQLYYNNDTWSYNASGKTRIIETNSSGFWKIASGNYGRWTDTLYNSHYCFSGLASFYTAVAEVTSEKKGDTKYSDVTSTNPNAYPMNGVQGNYWYLKSNPK